MKKTLFVLAFAAVLVPAAAQGVKPAAFAGPFYPEDAVRLDAAVSGFLAAAKPAAPLPGRLVALIAPHAGYAFSGPTAGAAYARTAGQQVDTVVIIGPSHSLAFEGCSVWPDGGFETPLGVARVDAALAKAIAQAGGYEFRAEAFTEEHSVEVQVPFVQKALPGAAIVPIVMGNPTRAAVRTLGAALAKTCRDKNVLVVASTDMSHYLPKAQAQATDARTIKLIQDLDDNAIVRKMEAGDNIMCGGGPVAAVLLMAKKAGRPRVEVLARTDSSSSGGPVVGYLAAAVVDDEGSTDAGFSLTPEEKTTLLRLARTSVSEYVERRVVAEAPSAPEKFAQARGVFVTLRKGGELRGCIGYAEAVMPLGRAVVQAAILAATEDYRFPPVKPAELKSLEVEVSVLTPLREISDARKVEVGRHGLVVERGERRGLLLPQVPVENGWDRDAFLEQGCLKAGLPPDAWRRGAKLYVFEAIVIKE